MKAFIANGYTKISLVFKFNWATGNKSNVEAIQLMIAQAPILLKFFMLISTDEICILINIKIATIVGIY